MIATAGLLAVGSVLILGAVGNQVAAAAGGFNNIGASFLPIVGAFLLIPSVTFAVTLATFYGKKRIAVASDQ